MHSLVARKQGRGQGHLKIELKPTFEWLEALHEHGSSSSAAGSALGPNMFVAIRTP